MPLLTTDHPAWPWQVSGTGHWVDQVARAIYETHWRPPSPRWDEVSEEIRDWVTAQAEAAIDAVWAAERAWHPRRNAKRAKNKK